MWDVSPECHRNGRMGISAADCGHWRTLFSHNYHFKWATWGSDGKCWAHLHRTRVSLKSFPEQGRKGWAHAGEDRNIIIKYPLMPFAVFWWSWVVFQVESRWCALWESVLLALVDVLPVGAQHGAHSPSWLVSLLPAHFSACPYIST